MPGVQSISLGVWINVGSRNENRKNNGITHFIEHMVFKGTAKRNTFEIAKSLESVGGSLNAFTGKETTCYIAHILPKHLPLAIDVLSDLIQAPRFEAVELNKEKNVIYEEIKSLEELPEELVHEHFQESLFPHHPLGYSILGTHNSITHLSRESVFSYWQKHYRSNRIIVSAAGNVDHDTLIYWTDNYFSSKPGSKHPPKRYKNNYKPLEKIIPRRIFQSHLCIGSLSSSYRKPEKYPLMILGTVLGGGMSSRLFQNIREKFGMAYSIYSFSEFLSDCGFFGVYLSTDTHNISKVLRLIKREFRRVRERPLSKRELKNAKVQLEGNLLLGMENPSSRMARIAKMEMHLGTFVPLAEVIDTIYGVSAEDVRKTAEKVLADEELQITMLIPEA
jgi:predicted Zn-dependent peptidase